MKNLAKLKDMLKAILAIEAYSPQSYESLLEDQKAQDAIMFLGQAH